VEIVVFASKTQNPHEIYSDNYFEREFPFVSISCDEGTTLASLIDEAAGSLGLAREGEISYLRFGKAETEDGYPVVYDWILDVVDERGVIRWHVTEDNWDSITLKNLKGSIEAGLIAGDLSEIHIILSHPFGNGFFIDWPVFLKQLATVIDWAIRAGFMVALLKAGVDVVQKGYKEWRAKGAYPEDIFRYIISRQSWDSRDLAKRLDINESEAKSLLRLFGFEYDRSSQLYVESKDKQTRLVYDKIKDIFETK